MNTYQSIVWIDTHEAHILRIESEMLHVSTIHARGSGEPEAEPDDEGRTDEESRFFHEVARALDVADEILVVGPSAAKLEFVSYMHKNEHARDPRILGVETVDHPTDQRLAAYAALYFKDRGPSAGNGPA
jgi:stalled ribosome rescue protein Dom34